MSNMTYLFRCIPHRKLFTAILLCSLLCSGGSPAALAASDSEIVVGSKNFLENRLLAEMFAQLIEARTSVTVKRRLGLAGTQVCFEALKTGGIDLYPEYTGTGLVTILGEAPLKDPVRVLNRVRTEFLQRWDIWWLSPLGFENSYALALRREQAESLNIKTISDLVRVAPTLTAGFGYEFIQREDGYPGLQQLYGLQFRNVLTMQQTLKYQATKKKEVDVLDVYTTDGRLAVYDFQVLEDDRHAFPPYEATALIRGEVLTSHPEIAPALTLLTRAFNSETMRTLNLRLQEKGESVSQVASDALLDLGLVDAKDRPPTITPSTSTSFFTYIWNNRSSLWLRTGEHLLLSGTGLALGILLGIPLALLLERWRQGAETIIRLCGMTQTIPSIALLAFMIPLFGVGPLPSVIALWLYSLFPILRNTYSGLRDAAPSVVETGRALGMTEWQILQSIRLPLSAPIIMAGVRTAAIWTVGTATLAAFIGAGGLGVPIVSGLQLADVNIILSGALPATILALCVDGLLSWIERLVQPRGLEIAR